jgi:hypothetical protein
MRRRAIGWMLGVAVLVAVLGIVFFLVRTRMRGADAPRSGPVVARVEASPDSTRIGQPVNIVFEVRTPAETRVAFAPRPANDSLWTWQSWDLARNVTSASGVHHRLEAVALPFRTGELIVPTPAYTVTREGGEAVKGAFPTLTVRVASVLPAEEPMPDIEGLKPPFSVPWWMRFPWWVVVVVVALAAVGLWLWRRRRRRKPTPVTEGGEAEPLIPAHIEALAALDQLAAEGLPGKGLWYQHQSRLSGILRHYLERRFGSSRESLTTRELCLHLGWRGLPAEDIERLRTLLRVADLAKFARTDPGRERSLGLADETRALIMLWAPSAVPVDDTAVTEEPAAETGS